MKQRTGTLVFSFLLFAIYSQAQIMKDWGWEKLDSTYLVCQYQYVHYNSVTETETTEITKLEIGKYISKFYSYDTFEFDSLGSTPSGKQIINERFNECLRRSNKAPQEDKMKILMEIPSRESEFMIYKNYPEQGKMLVQDAASKEYYKYTEDMPLQSWEIKEDTLSIIGYLCQKAICQWRGREYTAWFAADIPLNDGPFKFCGLPGLIMKVEDNKQQFRFNIQGIKKDCKRGIYLAKPQVNGADYKDTDRKKVLANQVKSTRNMIRLLNRDMQQLGKSHRTSEDIVDIMECDYK